MMYFVYSVLLTAGLFFLTPYFLFQAWRHGKYLPSLGERLGRIPDGGYTRPVIWLHCVSVGETQAARPLAQAVLDRFPDHDLVVSTTTITGQAVAREVFDGSATQVFYFPFDFAFAVRRALDHVRPAVVLIMETEIWPNFLRECGRRQIPVAIVNGRLSERSFRRYRYVNSFIRRVLRDVRLAGMQSQVDAQRITALGLASDRAAVTGNVKFDLNPLAVDDDLRSELRERFGLDNVRPVVICASTHDPEEEVCLTAFRELRKTQPNVRLLLAPRHPERFETVAELLRRSEFAWSRRSETRSHADRASDVILLDSIGELRSVLGFGELVFVGGSIAPTGGHNILEPAALQKCIVTGSHTFNFNEIMRVFRAADAVVQLEPLSYSDAARELAHVFSELLADDRRRNTLAAEAFGVVVANRGATARTIEAISPLIPMTPTISSERNSSS
jgi:3-deoxy-D-manno-octulosonic-acid transferase